MEKDFVPYEIALELKEIGFDEPCLGWYYLDEGLPVFIPNYQDLRKQHVKAPLFQQAFRWFREKYKLFSSINVDCTMEPKFCYSIQQYMGDETGYEWECIVFNSSLEYTYEKAELECLRKLIEIAKNKNL